MSQVMTIATVVMALAAVVSTFLLIRARKAQKSKFKIFVSIQCNDLTEDEYKSIQSEVLAVVEFARNLANIEHIYYFNRNIPTKVELDSTPFDGAEYIRQLQRCDYFIAIFQKRVHSSIYAEAGFAIAENKKCIFYTRRGEHVLPTVLSACTEFYEHVKRIDFEDTPDVARMLKGALPNLGGGSVPKTAD